MATYSVNCECGKSIAVAQSQAVASVICDCGKTVPVPLLSALRRAAGESNRTIVEELRFQIASKELPYGNLCPFSGKLADDVVTINVQCERSWTRGGEELSFAKFVWFLTFYCLFGWLAALVSSILFRKTPIEEFGRETVIDLPLKVSAEMRSQVIRMRSQNSLKTALRTVPIYEKLLDEYPDAVVSVNP